MEIAFDREGGKVYWSIVYDFGSSRQSYGGLLRADLDGFGMERVLERAEVVGLGVASTLRRFPEKGDPYSGHECIFGCNDLRPNPERGPGWKIRRICALA